jgi:hypothetical protein
VRGGRKAKLVGDAFEVVVDEQHRLAGWRGILAHVVHNEAHSKVVGGRLIYSAKGVADYTGVLHGGWAYAAECKSTEEDHLYKSEVTSEQQRHLDAVSSAGGQALAFLLVEFRGVLGVRLAIPWREVPWSVARSAERVVVGDCKSEWVIGECFLSRYHAGSDNRYVVGEPRKHVFPSE